MATARQRLLSTLFKRSTNDSENLPYVTSPEVEAILDGLNVERRLGDDGIWLVPGGADPNPGIVAVESALYDGDVTLLRAFLDADQERAQLHLQARIEDADLVKAQATAELAELAQADVVINVTPIKDIP